MLKLTWKMLISPDVIPALNKLYNCDKMPFPETYTAGRIADACRSQLQKAHEKNTVIIKKWAKKDEKGVVLPSKDGVYEFPEGDQAKYENEVNQLASTEFEVKGKKIHISKIPDALLTGAEALSLTDILEGLESLD